MSGLYHVPSSTEMPVCWTFLFVSWAHKYKIRFFKYKLNINESVTLAFVCISSNK